MPASIGFRAYILTLRKKGKGDLLNFDIDNLRVSPQKFIRSFVSGHAQPMKNDSLERSWYFEEKSGSKFGIKGYIHYGTFGFESNFVDAKTKKRNYRRQKTDVEEIPLFFEYWYPEGANKIFVIFQSFQGRSCIAMILSRLKEVFEISNDGYSLIAQKILPAKLSGKLHKSPVKRLRLIRKKASSDLADRYIDTKDSLVVDYELSISARRNSSLGNLSGIFSSFNEDDSNLFLYEGIEFEEAIAEVKVGKRIRRVGVLGHSSEAGVIDLSDSIRTGIDGHPTFASLERESEDLMKEFHSTLKSISK